MNLNKELTNALKATSITGRGSKIDIETKLSHPPLTFLGFPIVRNEQEETEQTGMYAKWIETEERWALMQKFDSKDFELWKRIPKVPNSPIVVPLDHPFYDIIERSNQQENGLFPEDL